MNDFVKININTATLDELMTVPGIGSALAQRIIDKRPFSNLDDLRRVSGIGENSFAPLKPYLTDQSSELPPDFQSFVDSIRDETKSESIEEIQTFDDESGDYDQEPVEENQDERFRLEKLIDESSNEIKGDDDWVSTEESEQEMIEAEVEIYEEEPEKELEAVNETYNREVEIELSDDQNDLEHGTENIPIVETVESEDAVFSEKVVSHEINNDKKQPEKSPTEELITQSQLIWSLLGTAIFSILLTILITLGILSVTNGGLRYATVSEANRLENQITLLNDLSTTMQTDIQGIRTRLDALETIAGKVNALEDRADSMEGDIGLIQTTIKEISETLTIVQDEILALQESAKKSEDFRSGLLQLLLEIEGQAGEGK